MLSPTYHCHQVGEIVILIFIACLSSNSCMCIIYTLHSYSTIVNGCIPSMTALCYSRHLDLTTLSAHPAKHVSPLWWNTVLRQCRALKEVSRRNNIVVLFIEAFYKHVRN